MTYLSAGVRTLLLSVSSASGPIDDASITIDEIRRSIVVHQDGNLDYNATVRQLDEQILPRLQHLFQRCSNEQCRQLFDQPRFCHWLTDKEVDHDNA
jgi:hypothetical protein